MWGHHAAADDDGGDDDDGKVCCDQLITLVPAGCQLQTHRYTVGCQGDTYHGSTLCPVQLWHREEKHESGWERMLFDFTTVTSQIHNSTSLSVNTSSKHQIKYQPNN